MHIVETRLQSRLSKLENRLWHSLDENAKFKLKMDLVRESYEIPEDSEIVRSTQAAIKEARGKDVGVSGIRAVGDPPILNGEAGVPTVFYGPFDFAKMTAHSDNEWVSVEDLAISSKVYLALALRYCA